MAVNIESLRVVAEKLREAEAPYKAAGDWHELGIGAMATVVEESADEIVRLRAALATIGYERIGVLVKQGETPAMTAVTANRDRTNLSKEALRERVLNAEETVVSLFGKVERLREALEKAVERGGQKSVVERAVLEERERCARIAEHSAAIHSNPDLSIIGRNIAAEIRNSKSEAGRLPR